MARRPREPGRSAKTGPRKSGFPRVPMLACGVPGAGHSLCCHLYHGWGRLAYPERAIRPPMAFDFAPAMPFRWCTRSAIDRCSSRSRFSCNRMALISARHPLGLRQRQVSRGHLDEAELERFEFTPCIVERGGRHHPLVAIPAHGQASNGGYTYLRDHRRSGGADDPQCPSVSCGSDGEAESASRWLAFASVIASRSTVERSMCAGSRP